MSKSAVAAIFILILCASVAGAAAQTNTITPADTFPIPQLSSQIHFAEDLNYTSAVLENNTWHFTGLKAGGYAGAPIRGYYRYHSPDMALIESGIKLYCSRYR